MGLPVGAAFPAFAHCPIPPKPWKGFNLLPCGCPGWLSHFFMAKGKARAPHSCDALAERLLPATGVPSGLGEVSAGFASWTYRRCQKRARGAGRARGMCPCSWAPLPWGERGWHGGHPALPSSAAFLNKNPFIFSKHTRSSLCQPMESPIICTKNFRLNQASQIKLSPR